MKQAIHMTHNRLVAGSNPAGATKFSDKKHILKPLVEAAFLLLAFRVAAKWRCIFTAMGNPQLIILSSPNQDRELQSLLRVFIINGTAGATQQNQ